MKILQGVVVVMVLVGLIWSCSKESATPSPAQTNGVNLAGASGSSKNWKMTAASYNVNASPTSNPISLSACVLDNVFTFTNNSSQDYIQTDGSVKCISADSTVTESGNWAFTGDGKSLVVEGEWFDDLSQESDFLFTFTSLGFASGKSASVVQLTATAMVISYQFIDSGDTISITVTFAKI